MLPPTGLLHRRDCTLAGVHCAQGGPAAVQGQLGSQSAVQEGDWDRGDDAMKRGTSNTLELHDHNLCHLGVSVVRSMKVAT